MRISGKGVGIAAVTAIVWVASLFVMLAGGYLLAAGTPCLCADVNGLLLGGGLLIIMAGAAALLWSSSLARRLVDRLTR